MTTTYAYGLASLTRTDPTGTSTATLDPFGRQATLDDPVTGGTWAWSYRADGQPASVTPPNGWGNVTSISYDAAGSLTGLTTTNAAFTYTLNRAGHRLTEAATVAGDPQNGTATFTFDPLGRLTGYALPWIRTLGASWQADTNRASLTTDGTPVATTFDAADRPTSTGFANDLDGRLTAVPARGGAPAKSLAYDALGRLVGATVAGVTRTYAYDPLDRLVTISEGGNPVVRIRYVGQTASVAQLLDGSWAVTRNIGTDATGTPLADWAAGGSGWRRLVSNGHGDLVATAAADGTISASLRLDPWGVPLGPLPAGYPAFGFQGSLTDRTTTLVYARARWYDPVLATFTSEDPLAGDIADPPSRHLYAYGAGDPVDRIDPNGLHWLKVSRTTTWRDIALHYYGLATLGAVLRNRLSETTDVLGPHPGQKYWLPDRLQTGTAATRRHTVFRGDDPIDMAGGYVFGPPYYGDPWTSGARAWEPAVISPTSRCSGVCAQPTGAVRMSQTMTGPMLGSRTWQVADFTAGWLVGLPLANSVDFLANVRRYRHGQLVTLWANYDYRGIKPLCGSDAPCLERVRISYRLRYTAPWGAAATTPGDGRPATTTAGGSAAWRFHRGPSAAPIDYDHFVVWFPRAAGELRSYWFRATATLTDGVSGVINSNVIHASSKPVWQWRP
jgi:RHS repeat-associated protein